MNIGLIAPEFPPQLGGVQSYSYNTAKELARRGHEVTVFTVPLLGEEISNQNFHIVRNLRLRRYLDLPFLQQYQFDVWHCTNACYSWLAKEFDNVVISVHGMDFLSPYFYVGRLDLKQRLDLIKGDTFDYLIGKWLTKRLIYRTLPCAFHIFCNSVYTEKSLLIFCPDCRGKTSLGMVGVGDEFFEVEKSERMKGMPVRLISVARFSYERIKNIDSVLKALAIIKEKFNFVYTVVGEGEQLLSLKGLAKSLGLEQRVFFTGRVEQDSLRKLLANSDLFIMTSSATKTLFEGFGIVYLEANACGVPVLAARSAGACEAVKEGLNGYFVEKPEVEQIVLALKRFMSGEIAFSADACRSFASQFTWAKIVDHFLKFYPKL